MIGGKPIENFQKLFSDRFLKLKSILARRPSFSGVMDIEYAKTLERDVKFVAIVDDVRESQYGKILSFEDTSGNITGYISRDYKGQIVPDDVVGVYGNISSKNGKLYINEIEYPGLEDLRKKENVLDVSSAIAVASDIHVGSKMFLEDRWINFIDWLNSSDAQAKRIEYLILAGDLVDGIGIYPGQNEDLQILDIYDQYSKLAEHLRKVPDRIKIILVPGNHDIVRVAEPQPALPDEVQKMFSENCIFLPNPAEISIYGYRILIYHGSSLNDVVELVPGMKYEEANKMMMELLKRRHLAPFYGNKVPLVPMARDLMVIETVPDMFITGHIHSYSTTVQNGIVMVNASTWQAQTNYQKMLNFNPNPGKVTIKQLNQAGITTKSF